MGVFALDKLMAEARRLARDYRAATGRSLPISAEIAKYDAVRLLDLKSEDRADVGYDALGTGLRAGRTVQIKGRAIFDEHKTGQRLGQLKLDKPWDLLVVVLMDQEFEPFEIYEIGRDEVEQALRDTAGSRRKGRGALSVKRLKIVGRLVWTRERGVAAADDGGGDGLSTSGREPRGVC